MTHLKQLSKYTCNIQNEKVYAKGGLYELLRECSPVSKHSYTIMGSAKKFLIFD